VQRGNIGTFLQSSMNVSILRSDRHSERFFVVVISDDVFAYINYPLTSMQRVGDEYQL
jgi:hypothetical protein